MKIGFDSNIIWITFILSTSILQWNWTLKQRFLYVKHHFRSRYIKRIVEMWLLNMEKTLLQSIWFNVIA